MGTDPTDAMFGRYNITSAQDLADGMGRLNDSLEAASATQNATLGLKPVCGIGEPPFETVRSDGVTYS